MKKIFILYILFSSSTIFAQTKISKIIIQSQNVLVQERTTYWTDIGPIPPSRTDTASPDINIINDSIVEFDGRLIRFLYSDSYTFPGTNYQHFVYTDSIRITIDTITRSILNLSALYQTIYYYSQVNPDYWDMSGSFIQCSDVPYKVSKNGDSLYAYLSGDQLKTISLSVSNLNNHSTSHTGSNTIEESIVGTPKNSFLSIILIGTFPLEVSTTYKGNFTSIIIDHSLKILKLPIHFLNQNQPLPCFDLLGRKHDLEFTGTDGNVSTYSVRSLKAGVYFVSDGKEMVKFIVGE